MVLTDVIPALRTAWRIARSSRVVTIWQVFAPSPNSFLYVAHCCGWYDRRPLREAVSYFGDGKRPMRGDLRVQLLVLMCVLVLIAALVILARTAVAS